MIVLLTGELPELSRTSDYILSKYWAIARNGRDVYRSYRSFRLLGTSIVPNVPFLIGPTSYSILVSR